MQASHAIPAEEVRGALARVLSARTLEEQPSLLEKFLEWLAPKLQPRHGELFGDVLLALFLAGGAAVLIVLVRRAWRAARDEGVRPAAPPPDLPGGAERLRELAQAARAARAAGDLRLALRHLFHALLVALGGRGDLELRPAWTNRELLRHGRASGAVRALLSPLVRELEPKEFGRAEVREEDVARLEALLAPHLARTGSTGSTGGDA
jgi:hypothetical protein